MRDCRLLAVVNCHEDTFEPYGGSKASVLVLQKRVPGDPTEPYRIFMAINQKIGQNSRGEPLFRRDQEGNEIILHGNKVLDHDIDDIVRSYHEWMEGRAIPYEFAFSIDSFAIKPPYFSFNPVRYLPKYNESVRRVLELGEQPGWSVRRLGDFGEVFNGPRFKRPYADGGVTAGPGIRRYYTGNAMTQTRGENIKYLDENKADKKTRRDLEALTVHAGWILITDSGTLGRVVYVQPHHEGAVVTNNMVRVVIEDPELRGYVYQFLLSQDGQNQLLMNTYGTNQDHLEPADVQQVLVPVPDDPTVVRGVARAALSSLEALSRSYEDGHRASRLLAESLEQYSATSKDSPENVGAE